MPPRLREDSTTPSAPRATVPEPLPVPPEAPGRRCWRGVRTAPRSRSRSESSNRSPTACTRRMRSDQGLTSTSNIELASPDPFPSPTRPIGAGPSPLIRPLGPLESAALRPAPRRPWPGFARRFKSASITRHHRHARATAHDVRHTPFSARGDRQLRLDRNPRVFGSRAGGAPPRRVLPRDEPGRRMRCASLPRRRPGASRSRRSRSRRSTQKTALLQDQPARASTRSVCGFPRATSADGDTELSLLRSARRTTPGSRFPTSCIAHRSISSTAPSPRSRADPPSGSSPRRLSAERAEASPPASEGRTRRAPLFFFFFFFFFFSPPPPPPPPPLFFFFFFFFYIKKKKKK